MANVVASTMLALLCVASATTSHHLAADKCRTGCHAAPPSRFKYAEGTTYKYSLESNVDIALSTAEGQQSATKLKATVLLTQQAQCVQVLRLQNVQILGADGKKKGAIPNIDKAIKLNFHDGRIEDVICAEAGDTQASLNVKRAVASLFQAAAADATETDVFGACPTSVATAAAADGSVVTYTKTRALNSCAHRESAKHDFATAFNLHSEVRAAPLLRADYAADMRVKDGVLDHVLLTESYLYVPFSVGRHGAKAGVQTKLQLAGKSKEAPKSKCTEPRSIIFENPHPTVSERSSVKALLDAVKDTANSITETVGARTASKFGQLIALMAAGRKDDLLAVYNQVQSGAGFADKERAKKVFLDALFRAGTGDCLQVSIQLLKSKQLSALEERMVYLGMSFIRHATPESIGMAASLLDAPKLPREAYLGVGALAARYCGAHDCRQLEQTKLLAGKLLAKLKDGKPADRAQEDEMITALKALANTKHLADSVVPKVVAIAQDRKNSLRLRVAALETYAADMCKDKLRDSAAGILKDAQQDAEVRIKAYLALAQCPNGKAAAAIKHVLDKEESYHVLGFIVSHLRALRASVNPDKALAKRELAAIRTSRRFPVDARKYSFFESASHSVAALGASGSVDASVIYSQSSFLPRSIGLNLTAEVFGQRVNFLELETRQENLDKLMERYLGPLGVLRNQNADDALAAGKATAEKLVDQIKARAARTRGKRHVPQAEIDAVGKAVHIKSNELNNDLDLDLSVKLFGSEFLFLTLNDDAAADVSAEKLVDAFFDAVDQGIEKAKNYQHTFTRNGIFMDAELAYPTSTGFPLKLAVQGTDSMQLVAETQMDVRALLECTKQSVAQVKLIPSANIELAGRLTLDAAVVESGLKVTSTLHTATGGAMLLELFADGVDAKLSLPVAKQEIVSADHQLVFVSRETGHTEAETPLKFVESKPLDICFDHLEQVVGLTFCAGLNSPNQQLNQGVLLPFPFNGNSQFKVFVTRDKPVTYHLRQRVHSGDKRGFEFVLETLDAAQKPMVSLAVEGGLQPEVYLQATLDSPIKKATVEARLTDSDKEKSVGARFLHDSQEYAGKLGVSVAGTDARATYKPLIEFVTPEQGKQKSPYTVEGEIVAEQTGPNVKYTFNNVRLVSPTSPAVVITGAVGREAGAYFVDVQLADAEAHSASLKGKFQATPNLLKADARFMNSLSPVSNFQLEYELKRDDNAFVSDLTLLHGGDLTNKQNTLRVKNAVSSKYTDAANYDYGTKNSFSYPLLGVEGKLNLHKVPQSVEAQAEAKYNKAKLAGKLSAKYNQKVDGDYDVSVEAEALESRLKAKAKRDIAGDVSTIEHRLEINDKKVEVKGTVTHRTKPYDTSIGCDLTIHVPQFPEAISVKHGYTHIADEVTSLLQIAKGAESLIDFDLKCHKVNGGNGHLKVTIADVVAVDGELKADKWNGKAHLVVDVVKAQRKIKLDSSFNLAAPKYNVAANFYPNFEKSPNKIALVSDNDVGEESVDSKNKLDVFGSVFEGNVKASSSGQLLDGKIAGEADLTLPDGVYFAGKLNREVRTANDLLSGNIFLNLEQRDQKNAPGKKLTIKGELKDTNLGKDMLDVVYNLAADDSNGKNINADLTVKYGKVGEERQGDIKGKVYGSVLAEPVEFAYNAQYTDDAGSYAATTKCHDGAMTLSGKYDLAGGTKPYAGSLALDVKTSNPKIKAVKLSAAGKFFDDDHKTEMGGAVKLFVDDDGTDPDATVNLEAEGDLSVGELNGQFKGALKVQKLDPITAAVGYAHKVEGGVMKCQADAFLKYADGKTVKADVALTRPSKGEGKLELKLETPFEQAKQSDIVVNYKASDEGKHVKSDLAATIDGKPYVVDGEIRVSSTNPLFKVDFTHDAHTDKIYLAAEHPSPHVAKGVVSLVHKDFVYHYDYDVRAPSVDDFRILINLNAPMLNANNVVYEIKNNKNNAIEVSVTGNGETLIKGTATYKLRDEPGKYIVEGSGEFTVKNDKKTGIFKYTRQQLTMEKDHEHGVAVGLDITLGDHGIDAEAKLTNKQFRIMNSYCKEKNQCQHFEIDSKTNAVSVAEYDSVVEVRIELGSYDFGMKTTSKRAQMQFDYVSDVHLQTADNKKYHYSVQIHPREASVSLTTPKRQLAVEGKVDAPAQWKGPAKAELVLYLDKKNEPAKKTALTGVIDVAGSDKAGRIVAEARLASPGLAKDLFVSLASKYDAATQQSDATLTLDVFAQPNSKLVATAKSSVVRAVDSGRYELAHHATITSKGMGIEIGYDEVDYSLDTKATTFKALRKLTYNVANHKCVCMYVFEASPTKLVGKVQLFDKELLNYQSTMQLSEEQQVIDTDAAVFGVRPLTSHFELKNFNALKYTLAAKDAPGKQLTVSAAFIPGQIADVRADVANQELVKASLQLDETNFLKPDYGVNLENVQNLLLLPAKQELSNALKEGDALLQDAAAASKDSVKQLGELAKANAPNLQGVKDYYAGEWGKVAAEISADPNIQRANEFLHKLFGAFIKLLSEVLTKAAEIVEQVARSINAALNKLIALLDTKVLPQLKATAEGAARFAQGILMSLYRITFGVMVHIGGFFETHQAELKQIATALSSIIQDVGRFVRKNGERARALITENVRKLYEELKALPIYEDLKARYETLTKDFGDWSEPLKHMVDDTLNTIQDIIPNEDAKKIVEAVRAHVGKKMKGEPVDDLAAIENIVRSVVALVGKLSSQYKFSELPLLTTESVLSDYFLQPLKALDVESNLLNYFKEADDARPWESVNETLYGVSLNPRSWLGPPFRLYGYLVQGQHIFTFDGKHLTFPGSCNYLVVRDAVNGNFTVGATFANGALAALTVADAAESVTIKKGGQLMHGKAAADFPLRAGRLHAFRTYDNLHVNSKAGLEVTCDPKLVVCKLSVSGYYHGQLRGLLGNGNNEAYDDFTLPSGKIVAGEAEFGNAYKMSAACKPVTTVDHHAHTRAPACTALFTAEDQFRACYFFVNPELYRTACDHGVAAGVKGTEEALARAYVTACNAKFVPAILPARFFKCTDGDKEYAYGDAFSVKLPGKAADVILIVEQAKGNEQVYKELVQPMVAELTKELAGKGVTDVEFHLVGYGGEYQKWPAHHTNGGKMSWKGKLPAMKFADAPKPAEWATGSERLDGVLRVLQDVQSDLALALGLNIQARAFYESYRYPFRAHATKTIIAFNSQPCKQGKLIYMQKLRAELFDIKNIHVNLVSPFNDFKVKDAKVSKTVVGFDDKRVMTFADAKKKSAGSTELHKELEVDDFCSHYLVKYGGAVFNADNFAAAKGPQRTQFVQVVSHTLADQILNTEQGLDCECDFRYPLTATTDCKSVYLKRKEH